MLSHTNVPRTTMATACESRKGAEALRERALRNWPSARLEIQHLAMFPRDLWFVQVWRTTQMRGLAGYIWEYGEEIALRQVHLDFRHWMVESVLHPENAHCCAMTEMALEACE